MALSLPRIVLLLAVALHSATAFHDCIQPKSKNRVPPNLAANLRDSDQCSGGLCAGMHNGPHEGGPAAYPVGNKEDGFTAVWSTFTVPAYPKKQDGICYYIWTDIFFGDVGYGRMNQFVPQLILGEALDGSSGPPLYTPKFGKHSQWMFGAHYFFETYNDTSANVDSHAAYGKLFPAVVGETLSIAFKQTQHNASTPTWTLTMAAVADPTRTSTVVVEKPYMGLGESWPHPHNTTSWAETNYTNLCINSCWELYGAVNLDHFPSSGSSYAMHIQQGHAKAFPWVSQWDEDEGLNKTCGTSSIRESHTDDRQTVLWDIGVKQLASSDSAWV